MGSKPSLRSNTVNADPRELNLVPYLDIVTNIIMFLLVTTTTLGAVGVINVASPKQDRRGAGAAWSLSVLVTERGFTVTDAGLAPGDAPEIPLSGGGYDYPALTRALAQIKKAHPAETRVNLAADQEIPFHVIVGTMDAARENPLERDDTGAFAPLFFDVVLATGL